MKLTKGLNHNFSLLNQPENSWYFGQNGIVSNKNETVSNEKSFELDIEFVNGILGNEIPFTPIGIIATNYEYVVFSTDGVQSEIGRVINKKYTTVIKDVNLNFNLYRRIKGTYVYRHNNNLVICFIETITENSNKIRTLNLDKLPFSLNIDFSLVTPSQIKLLHLFPDYSIAILNLNAVADTSGTLVSGAYFFTASYGYNDKTETNKFPLTQPIYIGKNSFSTNFTSIEGGEAGTITGFSIKLDFENVDKDYSFINLYVVKQINQIKRAFKITELPIDVTTFTYTGSDFSEIEVAMSNVVEPNAVYSKAEDLTNFNSSLFFIAPQSEKDIDLQETFNNINVNWNSTRKVELLNRVGSNKDADFTFLNKSFQSNEVYALYGTPYYKNGRIGKAFLIPGREAIAGDTDIISAGDYVNDNILNPSNVKKFQTRDTSVGNGMSYWENKDEVFPKGFYDLEGEKIRFHKFPSKRHINDISSILEGRDTSIFEATLLLDTNRLQFDAWTAATNFTVESDVDDVLFGKNTVVALVDCIFSLHIDLVTNIFCNNIEILIEHLNSLNSTIDFTDKSEETNLSPATEISEIKLEKTFKLRQGEKLRIRIKIDGNTVTGIVVINTIADINTKQSLLGLDFSNLIFSQEAKDNIDFIEISYAKRNPSNCTVLANSLLISQFWNDETFYDATADFRLHSFDLLLNSPALNADYIDINFEQNCYDITANTLESERIFKIESLKYVQIDNPTLSNDKREQAVIGKISVSNPNNNPFNHPFLEYNNVVLKRYKENVYVDFVNQELVSTGLRIKLDDIVDETTVFTTYNGDIYNTTYGFSIHHRWYESEVADTVMCDIGSVPAQIKSRFHRLPYHQFWIPTESIANIEMRNSPSIINYASEYFFPTINVPMTFLYNAESGNFYRRNYPLLYNSDYSAINNLNSTVITDFLDTALNNIFYYTRIIYSNKDGDEQKTLGWRTFLSNNYYEMPKNKGKGKGIFSTNTVLYINLEFALYIAQIKDRLETNNGDIYIKQNNIFDILPNETVSIDSGYVGNSSIFGKGNTVGGFLNIDRKRKKIFLIQNNSAKEISSEGLYNYFLKHLDTFIDVDNPFTQVGLMWNYDNENKRIIISKKDFKFIYEGTVEYSDYTYEQGNIHVEDNFYYVINDLLERVLILFTDETYFEENSFTFSYSFENNYWAFYHNYFPNYLFDNANGCYAIKDKKVFKMNKPNSYGRYFSQSIEETKPFFIDIPFNTFAELSKDFISVTWNTDVYDVTQGLRLWNKTFTHIMIYTENQCSGMIPINYETTDWFSDNLRNVKESWNFSEFRDILISAVSNFINDNGVLDETKLNYSMDWFDKKKFIGKFVIVRLYYDNLEQKEIYLNDVDVNINHLNQR